MKRAPRVIIIAGPTGAGKTTFAREFLLRDIDCPQFVNADLIAAGLAPFAPASAALPANQVMRQELERLFAARASFGLETALVEPDYLPSIARWRDAGYCVTLIFLQLNSAELAIARTFERALVSDVIVDAEAIRREWLMGFRNFEKVYAPAVDGWALYDNSDVEPMLLGWHENTKTRALITHAKNRDLRRSFNALQRTVKKVHEMAELTQTPIVVSRQGVLMRISSGLGSATVSVHEPEAIYGN